MSPFFKNVLCLFCLFLGGEELRFLSGDGKESALPLSLTYVALLCIFERLIPTSQHTYLMSFCLKNSIKYTNSIWPLVRYVKQASWVAQWVKNLLAVQEMEVQPWVRRSPGGGHGNPLQYSCLENPMDRGAWWATVHRVSKSQTWSLQHKCSSGNWQLLS